MDAFENLIALLLRRDGYWTDTSVKVALTKRQKAAMGKPSSPRWEVDVVGYKGSTNELLVVECESYLDSYGVRFKAGVFHDPDHYKLFTDRAVRDVVLPALADQFAKSGSCQPNPTVTLCLATGKIAKATDKRGLTATFEENSWRLFDDAWVRQRLATTAHDSYQNETALVVAKLLLRE